MKLDIQELPKLLQAQNIEQEKIKQIILAAENLAATIKEENKVESDEPKKKNEFLVVMYKTDIEQAHLGIIDSPLAYVVTQKEGEDAGLVLGRLSDAAREFNGTKKGKKRPILSFGDLFSSIKRKFVKNQPGGININSTLSH